MKAKSCDDVLVSSVETFANLSILTVNLSGDTHYDMYRQYASLPDVVVFDGDKYGKSCWDSDKGLAYYRNDRLFASPCRS